MVAQALESRPRLGVAPRGLLRHPAVGADDVEVDGMALELAERRTRRRAQRTGRDVRHRQVVGRGMTGLQHPDRGAGPAHLSAAEPDDHGLGSRIHPRWPREVPHRLLAGAWLLGGGTDHAAIVPQEARTRTMAAATAAEVARCVMPEGPPSTRATLLVMLAERCQRRSAVSCQRTSYVHPTRAFCRCPARTPWQSGSCKERRLAQMSACSSEVGSPVAFHAVSPPARLSTSG